MVILYIFVQLPLTTLVLYIGYPLCSKQHLNMDEYQIPPVSILGDEEPIQVGPVPIYEQDSESSEEEVLTDAENASSDGSDDSFYGVGEDYLDQSHLQRLFNQ